MFILTIGSNDPKTVLKCLRELARTKLETNANCGDGTPIPFEYDYLPRQPHVGLLEFLHFNPDGNTLKKPE